MMPPTNKLQEYEFIGFVNYYREMRSRQSHSIQTLTALMSDKATFKWTDVEQKMFEDIKNIVTHDTLLVISIFRWKF